MVNGAMVNGIKGIEGEKENSNKKDLESNKQVYLNQENVDYSHDYPYSLTLVILGIFLWIPFFFNFIYIKSPNKHARRIAFASIMLGSVYFVGVFITLSIFLFTWLLPDYYNK